MKSFLRYITLLIFGGVMIPLCGHPGQTLARHTSLTAAGLNMTCDRPDSATHFSFIHDVAAKVLPILKILK